MQSNLLDIPAELPNEKHFYMCNGTALKNLHELAHHFAVMSDDEFNHHVRDGNNDFSNWARDVFNEHALADQLHPLRCRRESKNLLHSHLLAMNRDSAQSTRRMFRSTPVLPMRPARVMRPVRRPVARAMPARPMARHIPVRRPLLRAMPPNPAMHIPVQHAGRTVPVRPARMPLRRTVQHL